MSVKFNKRLYKNFWEFTTDLRYVFSRRDKMKTLLHGGQVSPAFRERLMMAVTEVNGCRYCNYYHTRLALEAGVSKKELAGIAAHSFSACPPDEQPALLYAQHWAESSARPTPEAANRLQEIYGEETADLINLSLRLIRVGNLTGNLFDYILFKLSFGRLKSAAGRQSQEIS